MVEEQQSQHLVTQIDTDITNSLPNSIINNNNEGMSLNKFPFKKTVIITTVLVTIGFLIYRNRKLSQQVDILSDEQAKAYGLYDDLELIATNDANIASKVIDNVNALKKTAEETVVNRVSETKELTEEERNKKKVTTADWLQFAAGAINSLSTGLMAGLGGTNGSTAALSGLSGSSGSSGLAGLTSLLGGFMSTNKTNSNTAVSTDTKQIQV